MTLLLYFYDAKQQLFRHVEKSKILVLLSNFNEKYQKSFEIIVIYWEI